MSNLARIFQRLALNDLPTPLATLGGVRHKTRHVDLPEIGRGRQFRRIIHYPEKYTVQPLNTTNLGGRDPESGRLVVKGIGGGIKHKYHWVEWTRDGPLEGPPKVERVIKIIEDGCRNAHIALVAHEDKLKYILATENMKAGDLIKTSSHIPRIPVRANEGDSYPLGALPLGTQINTIEKIPGRGGNLIRSAGTFATIVRKAPNNHIVIRLPSKREYSLPQECMCTVGKLSNANFMNTPVGSAQRNRELGNRPRSGLWQRKSGRHGRKIKGPKPMKVVNGDEKKVEEPIVLTAERPFVKTMKTQFHY